MSKRSFNSNLIKNNLNQIYLILILIGAFLVRLIPSRSLTFAGNDAYLHHDIVMRMVDQGFGLISSNPVSWLGLSSYGYPPLYHVLGTVLYNIFHSQLVFFLLPPLLGLATILVFYKISQELFSQESTALLSTLLFAFVPSFVTRTAVFIPESLGLFLFTCVLYFLIRYVKTIPGYENLDNFSLRGFFKIFNGDYKYLLFAIAIWILYLFTHRGWIFLAITLVILVITFTTASYRKKPVTMSLLYLILIFGFFEFISSFARFQDVPVNILGFPKWIGVIQIIFGIYGIVIFIRSKNALHRFIALWAVLFLLMGTNSFRFRDPYSTIPLSLVGGYVFAQIILPKLNNLSLFKNYKLAGRNFGKYLRYIVILILILTPVAQGAVSAYSSVVQASPGEIEAFQWIENETPVNATFLTFKDNAYLLIGNTHRKDVALWKTVYEGLMGDAPTLSEMTQTNNAVSIIFGTARENEAHYMLNEYNVSYVYVTKGMYSAPAAKYGLISYMPYDTHFKTSFVSPDASVYQYIANPSLQPPTNKINATNNTEYGKSIEFIEEFWNGYSYSEMGMDDLKDENLNFEYGDYFKGNYNLNAQIALLYSHLSQKTGNSELNNRSDYLINWLTYKQMSDGAFTSNIPPQEYTLGTMETIFPLLNLSSDNNNKTQIINKGLNFVNQQTGSDTINITNTQASAKSILGRDYKTLKTDAQVSGMYPSQKEKIIYSVIDEQNEDGSWTSNAYENIEILKGISLYYNSTQDQKALESIKKGAKWLKENQNPNGSFKDDGTPVSYGINYYADALLIYHLAGDDKSAQNTLQYITGLKIRQDITPLKSYLTLISDLTMIYGEDTTFTIVNKLL